MQTYPFVVECSCRPCRPLVLAQCSNVLCVQSVYISVLLSHTVLSELYQEKLVTEDEVKSMKEQGGDLSYRIVRAHCTKPPKVVTRTTIVLGRSGHNEEAKVLRGW